MGAKRLDQILVIDLEATCWEHQPPPGQEREIIEIGICTLDVATGERLARRSILVKPERSSVSPFCTQLTTLTQEQVERGVSFPKACLMLKKEYRSHERVWASYGEYDRNKFDEQCRARGIPYPFDTRHLNIKSLFGIVQALPREVGLAEAMRRLGLPLEGTPHRGVDDAWNAALILSSLLLKRRLS